ncbi:MAG: TetR family transcriptional regulator [Mycobacteriales bacterium]
MARSGRRPGESGSREAILDAARASFAQRGYDGTTIRAIARDAGVDAALVHHFFGTKDAVFVEAMGLSIDPAVVLPALLASGLDGLGERLVRFFVGVWDDSASRSPFVALIRSAVSHDQAADMLRGFVSRQVLGRVAAALDQPAPELRAALVGSQLVGLGMVRYVIKVEPLASADIETVVSAIAPTVQRYLTGQL